MDQNKTYNRLDKKILKIHCVKGQLLERMNVFISMQVFVWVQGDSSKTSAIMTKSETGMWDVSMVDLYFDDRLYCLSDLKDTQKMMAQV